MLGGKRSGRVCGGGKCLSGARPGSKVGARPIAGLLPSTTAPGSPCDRARAAHLSSVTRCCTRAPPDRPGVLRACSKSAAQNQHRSLSRASQAWRLLVPSSQLSGASALVGCPALNRLFGELHTAQTAARLCTAPEMHDSPQFRLSSSGEGRPAPTATLASGHEARMWFVSLLPGVLGDGSSRFQGRG